MQFNRQIAFVQSWRSTLITSCVVGVFIVFVMVFLQPFDTFQSETNWKSIKLAGYFFTFWIPIMCLYPLEKKWYRAQSQRWTLINEGVYSLVIILLIAICSYFYHAVVFSNGAVNLSDFSKFFVYYDLPFIPLLLPLLLYLRYQLGTMSLSQVAEDSEHSLSVSGENKNENLTIRMDQFVFAEAKQNYVDIYYLEETGTIASKMFRTTLSSIVDQIHHAHQIHRSYLINLAFVKSLEGNARKRVVRLEHVIDPLPVSRKYFEAMEAYLQNRPR